MPTGRVGAMKRTERTGDEKMERGGFNLQKRKKSRAPKFQQLRG